MSLNPGAGFVIGHSISTAARLLYEVPATLELQRQQFEARLAFDRDHLAYEHQKWLEQRREARIRTEAERRQRLEEIVKSAELKLILDNWPLKTAPSIMMRIDDPAPPPYILLALPASMPERLMIEEEVRTVLDTYYAFGSPRPVEFLGASWSGQARVSEVIKQMATVLASEPTLVVEVEEITAGQLRMRLGFWGTFGKGYTYRSIAKLPWPGAGKDDKLPRAAANALYLSICLSVMIANFADGYHRLYRGVVPLLPSLLPSLLESLTGPAAEDLRSIVESSYTALFRRVAAEEPASEPDILLELSEVFAVLGDVDACRQQVLQSVKKWADLRGLEVESLSGAVGALLESAKAEDRPYLEKLEHVLDRLRENGAEDIRKLLENWPATHSTQQPLASRLALAPPRPSERIWQPSSASAKAPTKATKKPERKTFL
jgi:hypothetical protein